MSKTSRTYHDEFDIKKLIPWEKNPKLHTHEQIARIGSSIKQFGFADSILADESGRILGGHGRYLAAMDLGLSTVPVTVLTGLTEDQKAALCVALNKLTMDTDFDQEALGAIMESLANSAVSIEDLGLFPETLGGGGDDERDQNTLDKKFDTYINSAVKQIVLVFTNDEYGSVIQDLGKVVEAVPELENNTMVFKFLLQHFLSGGQSAHS
jgi:hypothetical protein